MALNQRLVIALVTVVLLAGAVALANDLRADGRFPPVLACDPGAASAEHPLVVPKPGTFYSVDALAPDVVKWRGRYLLYFSGNSRASAAGRWRTGLAVASSPLGPFRVDPSVSLPYLNGGTVAWKGQLWQATEDSAHPPLGELLTSSDGRHWRSVAPIPQQVGPYRLTADYSLHVDGGTLRLYAIGRTDPAGLQSRLISIDYRDGHWGPPKTLLAPGREPWNATDLGEPAAFKWRDHTYLLYTATAAKPFPRSVALAVDDHGWRECSAKPMIAAGAAPWGRASSIDAVGMVEGDRLYVYYGATQRLGIASNIGGSIGVRAYHLGSR